MLFFFCVFLQINKIFTISLDSTPEFRVYDVLQEDNAQKSERMIKEMKEGNKDNG